MSNIKLNILFRTVCIASDHAGYNLKEDIKNHLIDKNISVYDLGPYEKHSVDYPDYARKLEIESLKKAMLVYWWIRHRMAIIKLDLLEPQYVII